MDLFRVGEALLRSPQPLLPFLAPSVYRARLPSAASRHQLFRIQPTRHLTSSSSCLQQESSSSPNPERSSPSNRTTPPALGSNITPEFGALLDTVLTQEKGTPAAQPGRTTRYQSASAQDYSSPSRLEASRQRHNASQRDQKGVGAISALLDTFKTPRGSANRRPPPGGLDIAAMLDPSRNVQPPTGPPPPSEPPPPPMKLNSSTGRTIYIDQVRGLDVARAFRALEMQVKRNKVKGDFMAQRYHERPGMKRKRLKRERWRKRFKENFKATVGMVKRMKAQGW